MPLHPGRIRKKLAALLEQEGLIIAPEHLACNEGVMYRNPGNDLARWFGCAAWRADLVPERGLICQLHSWDKMTDCVRHGFTLLKQDGWRQVEVVHK